MPAEVLDMRVIALIWLHGAFVGMCFGAFVWFRGERDRLSSRIDKLSVRMSRAGIREKDTTP